MKSHDGHSGKTVSIYRRRFGMMILQAVCIALLFTGCGGCSLNYSVTDADGLTIGYSRLDGNAFVGCVTCAAEQTEIVIPDAYNGLPVTNLGGYFGRGVPTPFYIEPPIAEENVFCTDNSEITESGALPSAKVLNLRYTLKIGKNIKDAAFVRMPVWVAEHDDGTVTVYRPLVYIEVDAGNRVFYAENGVMYRKADHGRVDGFLYALDFEK